MLPAVPRSLRHRLRSFARLLAMAALLLAVLVQPVLAAVADLHEASHGQATHASHAHDAQGEVQIPDGGDPDEGRSLLHALMHAGHCCGQASAVDPASPLIATMRPTSEVPSRGVQTGPGDSHPSVPFRPPIVG